MMKIGPLLMLSVSALVLGGPLVGCSHKGGPMAAVNDAMTADAKKAAGAAADARKALAKRNSAQAVKHAEAAVAADPRNAEHRALLGQAYLMAGRFTSAGQALQDALALDPANGRAALNLALAQIGTGDWAGARTTLTTHSEQIPASDRGLALALAGDPVTGIEILGEAARNADAGPKTRQNLALAMALAGRWSEAKSVASVDVAPDQIDARIMQWVAFAKPANAYDQVASLLGVSAVADGGQPTRLALNETTKTMAAIAQVIDPLDAYMPKAESTNEPTLADAEVQAVAASGPLNEPANEAVPVPAFAERQEIVQAIPVRVAAPAAVRTIGKGKFYVQLGAYASPAVARDSWRSLSRRTPVLADHAPAVGQVRTRAGTFHRLSVGGFDRASADGLCGQVKSSGGACFVRQQAGDMIASWAKGVRMAAR